MIFRYNSPLAPAPAPVSSPQPPQQQQQQQQQQWSGADSSASGTPNDPASLDGKRQRVSRACDRCRQKKVKCDGKRPVCTHCEAISATCTYLDATKKRGPPKGYIEVIENRLHKVEELLCALVESDPKTAKYIVDNLRSADGSKAAVVSDTNGKLFGMYTMDELESKAAMPAAQQPPRLSSAANADTETQPTARFTSTAPARDALASSPLMDDDIYPDESLLPAPLFTSRSKQSESPRLGGMPLDACNAEEREGISTPDEDDEHIENLTKLEKRVGHLTLDQSGSLRYLGNSSGWYIINRSLISSEATPRLSRGVEGAIRWPPISTIPGRDAESGNESLGTAAPAAQTTSPSTRGGPANGSYEALAFAAAAVTAQKTARARPKDGSQNQQSINVSVPRNLPPCGKPPMPDDDEKTRLLTLYFRYVHPGFPILYKSHFLKTALSKDNTQSPALMSAVYAAASTYKAREATNETELAKVRIEMVVHFQRAKLYLDEQYTLNTTATILTLLLMSVYEQGTMSTRSWLYSGMAVRKAYDMGLHRDVGAAKNNLTSVVSDTEAEIRQRAWWGCYIMDIMVSATLGRPTTIRDFTFDAPYPTNYGEDDDELWLESSIPSAPVGSDGGSASKSGQWPPYSNQQGHQKTSQQQQQKDNGSNKSSSHTGQDPKSSVPVAERMREYVALTIGDSDSDDSDEIAHPKTKKRVPLSQKRRAPGEYYLDLLHIFGHILTEMYTCKPHRSFAAQFCLHDVLSRSERLIALDHELRRWKASLPSYLQYSVDDILMVRPARCVYIALIHLVYHTALILLHRPFISKLGEQNNGGSGGGGGNNPASPMAADEHHHGAGSDLGSPGGSVSSGGSARTGTTTSPLPSHSICTLSAQMISLIGQAIIQDSRIFIMPFLTFMMFTAGTMHLNNVIVAADSWLARRFLKRTLEVMSRIGAHWQVSYKCYTMLNTLVRANRIGLEQVIDDPEAGIRVIKERSSEVAKIAHWVYENRSLYRNQVASSKMGTAQTSSSPRFRQSISSRQGSFGPGTSRLSSMPNGFYSKCRD
ncbi:hypothetical protein GGI07_002095 [Coemansia sp. Benny D115]|nr:hypothetical protein GGI07_002095 [Coemansia sp. Benny D115]